MTLRVFDLFVQVVDKSDTCRLFELYWTQAYSWVRLYNTLFRFVTWQRTLETYYFKGRADMFKADVNFRRWRSYSHLGRVIAAQTAKYVTLTWRVVRATTFVRRVIKHKRSQSMISRLTSVAPASRRKPNSGGSKRWNCGRHITPYLTDEDDTVGSAGTGQQRPAADAVRVRDTQTCDVTAKP